MIKCNKFSLFAQLKKSQKIAYLGVMALFMVSLESTAVETNIELHKTSDSGGYGYSLGLSDNFFKQQAFNWRISYNRLENIAVNVDVDGIERIDEFPLDTVDLLLTYRYTPKTYNHFLNKLTYEFQAGVGIGVTENKFVFTNEGNVYEEVLSESGDVNAALGFAVYYKMSKHTSMYLGAKVYPDYSAFGTVTSAFIGFNYHFGRKGGY